MSRIAVLGAGAWGTALALSLARRGGHELILWSHSPALAEQLNDVGENLPLPSRLHAAGRHHGHFRPSRRHLRGRHSALRHSLAASAQCADPNRPTAHS